MINKESISATDSEYINKLHSEILNVMDEIDNICTKNGIQYYLIGGTLLGAIRHRGFIPWDDDFDICMPRSDFNRFIEIAPRQLKKPFKLSWITTKEKYCRAFAKVYNSNTIFFEGIRYDDSNDYPGIFVDVFPLDNSHGYTKGVEFKKFLINKMKILMDLKARDSARGLTRIICNLIKMKKLHKIQYYLMNRENKNKTLWYTNYGSQYNAKRQTIMKKRYGQGKRAKFEDRMYIIPKHSEEILKSIFGENYMELPPVEKRRTHYPILVKFSDGSEIRFKRPKNRIKIDQD